jgi:hypothetical protein
MNDERVRDLLKDASAITSNFYPEMLGKMFIVNAPWFFTIIWKMASKLVPDKTRAKIEILGTDYQSKLFEFIDRENLPEFLSGTCNCPRGCMFSNIGPWNPDGLEYNIYGNLKNKKKNGKNL